MCQPVTYLKISIAIAFVAPDAILALQFFHPPLDQPPSVLVVWVEKAREHSRISAKPPGIVSLGPELDEEESGVAANTTHTF
jgi:hypothetical protein